ncbi:Na+/H+ antiporter subunit E [Thiohalorhabdus methylotrophus]|uniref:Na+/H+ antiporter subunit E n=1 Tax=Thiohalorhabdus methylotrophus TaxID=3242694 RepID=A0ABV4TRR5_9GAMM
MVRTLLFGAALAGLWILLTGGAPISWIIGGPFVAAGALAAHGLRPDQERAIHPVAALAFLPFFLFHSLRGGWDVALRAFHPALPLAPGHITYPCRLPPGPARLFFGNVVNLLPGTLSVGEEAEGMTIHVLDRTASPDAELAILEARVAAVFGTSTERSP